MTELRTLEFSYNWNQKLCCDYFTTLRLSGRFEVGEWVLLFLKNAAYGRGIVVGRKVLTVGQLNAWVCGIDTGYTIEETKAILSRMHPGKITDTTTIYLYLIRKESKKELAAREKLEGDAQRELFK